MRLALWPCSLDPLQMGCTMHSGLKEHVKLADMLETCATSVEPSYHCVARVPQVHAGLLFMRVQCEVWSMSNRFEPHILLKVYIFAWWRPARVPRISRRSHATRTLLISCDAGRVLDSVHQKGGPIVWRRVHVGLRVS